MGRRPCGQEVWVVPASRPVLPNVCVPVLCNDREVLLDLGRLLRIFFSFGRLCSVAFEGGITVGSQRRSV